MSTSARQFIPKVLVFDSGVGGLSILQEIHRHIPRCQLVYACDNQAFPYGTKAEDELVARVDAVLKALIAAIQPDIVVVACNTASTLALPRIRAHFANPVVGVVPAIKPAAAQSQSKVIGLLATPGTVQRRYTQELIDQFAADCTLVRVGSGELVDIAEQKLRGQAPDPARLAAILAPLFDHADLDTVVLACTHFPLLRPELEAVAPRAVHWIDSGEAIARRVHSLIDPDLPPPVAQAIADCAFPCWLTDGEAPDLMAGLRRAGASAIHTLDLDPGGEPARRNHIMTDAAR